MKNINKLFVLFILTLGSVNYSCKKFLDIGPPKDSATPVEIFANDVIATSAITGIYSRMAVSGGFSGGQNSISVLTGLSADDLKSHSVSMNVFYNNEIPATNLTLGSSLWAEPYTYIYTCNAILEGLQSTNGVTEKTSNQLQGEAKFIRAFCYFYLINLFGEVPLNLTTDYRINKVAEKSSREKIYAQITTDLLDAKSLLSADYISQERIRPNKWAAAALLARVYLYNQKWDLAAQEATQVINQNATYELVQDLDRVFIKNSKEAIWQLMPTAGNNTNEGALFILTGTPTSVSLSSNFASLFEPGDNRKVKWISVLTNTTGQYFFPFKYKIKTTVNAFINEYSMVIRFAELYLIRAEARANLIQTELALEDLNLIRKRAGILTPLTGLDQTQCLAEVEKQRRFELFTEWGHRWLDLKRTGRASAVLAPIKGSNWQETDVLYPIPFDEISRNPSIGQN